MRGDEPLIAFTVAGIPKSTGCTSKKSRQNLRLWREKVGAAAVEAMELGRPPAADPVSLCITHYYWEQTTLDVDNIAKPIADALAGIVYIDDRQIEQMTLRKTNQARDLRMVNPPAELAEVLYKEPYFVHVRCYGPPDHRVPL